MAREAGSPPGSAAMVVARRRPRAVQARNVGRRSKRHALTIFVAPLLRGADWRSATSPSAPERARRQNGGSPFPCGEESWGIEP